MAEPVASCVACDQPVSAKGMCRYHYKQAWDADRANDPDRKAARTAYFKAYYIEHKADYKARGAKDQALNNSYAEHKHEYYLANKDAILQRNKAFYETHKDAHGMLLRAYRARKMEAPVCDFTLAQWRGLKELFGHCCAYCTKPCERLTQDHIVPLSQGGSHTASNIVPACKQCNSMKHTASAEDFVDRLLSLGTI